MSYYVIVTHRVQEIKSQSVLTQHDDSHHVIVTAIVTAICHYSESDERGMIIVIG
jgi:hypothetical protein